MKVTSTFLSFAFCWLQTVGYIGMLEARQCCGGNEILKLVNCIFEALNVQHVDLLDASHVRVSGLCCVSRNIHAVSGEGRRDRKRESDVLS